MIGRTMIASTMAAVRIVRPVADGGPAKNGQEAEVLLEPVVERHQLAAEEADAPEAVDDARDGGQQVDEVADRAGEPARARSARSNSATPIASGVAMSSARVAASRVPKTSGQT